MTKAQFFAKLEDVEMQKLLLGQFFTILSPFNHPAFLLWAKQFSEQETILEPFAGANHIIRHLQELGLANNFSSFDISPADENVIQQDTIKNFPVGFNVGITNPPYLAMASLRNKKLSWSSLQGHEDMYLLCLELMLNNLKFVAAIIPESFITKNFYRERLQTFISLTKNPFNDTATPVCLALWGPNKSSDFAVWSGNQYLGLYSDLCKFLPRKCSSRKLLKFNDPHGEIALFGIDNSTSASIRFSRGVEVNPKDVSVSSRHITRISFRQPLSSQAEIDEVIMHANKLLAEFRISTGDVFLTPFKNLRDDGKYRRRLDFAIARDILSQAYQIVSNASK